MVVFSQVSEQHLVKALGQGIISELSEQMERVELVMPEMGKLFWRSQDSRPCIYIVLQGKIRVIDRQDNLVVTLTAGESFGELTLFADADFQDYSVRASADTKLGYFAPETIISIIERQSAVKEHLYLQAKLKDLLLLNYRVSEARKRSDEPNSIAKSVDLYRILPRLDNYQLPVGKMPKLVWQEDYFWLRSGEIVHSSNQKLIRGKTYTPQDLTLEGEWNITSPVDLYCFRFSAVDDSLSEDRFTKELDRDLVQLYSPEFLGVEKSDAVDLEDPIDEYSLGTTKEIKIAATDNTAAKTKTESKKALSRAYFPSPTLQVTHLWQKFSKRYPFFLQQSASDCGAACLVMLGRYWGKKFSINRLRSMANVDRSGATLKGLADAAEGIGFSSRMVTATLSKLAEQTLPAIAHWEGKHYIVIYKITRDRVIVADPAIGQITMSHEEFNRGWTGYTLLLQPNALLKKTSENSNALERYTELIKPYRGILIEIALASVAIQIFGLVVPLLTQLLLDRVVVQRSNIALNTVGTGLLIFGLFQIAMTGLRQYLLAHTANRIDLALIVGFVDRTFRLPLSFFETRYVGDIISRIQENRKIQSFLTGEALSIILDLLTIFFYLGLMFWYSWKLSLMIMVLIPFFIIMALVATPYLKRISREIFSAYNQETKYLIQSLTGIRTVKSMAVEQQVRGNWEELFGESIRRNFSGQLISNTLQMVSSLIQTLITVGLLWFGAWQVINDELTIGQLVAFNMLLGNVISPFNRLTMLWNDLQEVLIAIERIEDVIDSPVEEDLQNGARQSMPPIEGQIKFENVSFRYQSQAETNTLENISFDVSPGQMVALVGRSGSGKTTISKMVLGFYHPQEGRILIDGYDLNTISLQSLRSQIGVVDQDTFLFGGTIRENISLGYTDYPLEKIVAAAKQAGAHDFIQEMPMGYETQIGEGGGVLSGGQRQRIAIARALLGDSRLLIFDEATSNLDTESERIIQNNLGAISQNRTTLVIAHRLSTIQNADLILVLDRGVLIETGTHQELMQKKGQYYYLNQQQMTVSF